MEIAARVRNDGTTHGAVVRTDGTEQRLAVSPKSAGRGSAVSGGEFLMLALATCCVQSTIRAGANVALVPWETGS